MEIEDIYLVVNFETDDIAEQMIREDDEQYPPVLEDEHVDNLLKHEDCSIEELEGSLATMQNINKTLYIRFDVNREVYTVTPLDYIQPLQKYIKFVTSFDFPKKVNIVDVSAQVGGFIDTNYGIKFKIKLTDIVTEGIKEEELYSSYKENQYIECEDIRDENPRVETQATLYIKALCGIANDDDSYDNSIDETVEALSDFYIEGLEEAKYRNHNMSASTYEIFHRKTTRFLFGSLMDEYYGIVFLEDKYLVYILDEGGQVNILCETKDIELAHIDILNYLDCIALSL